MKTTKKGFTLIELIVVYTLRKAFFEAFWNCFWTFFNGFFEKFPILCFKK